MTTETCSIRSHHGSKSGVEKAAQVIFTACGFFRCSGCCIHYTVYDYQRHSRPVSGGSYRYPVRFCVEAGCRRSQLWYLICYPDFCCGNLPCDPDRSSYWSDDRCVSGGNRTEKDCIRSAPGSRTSGWNSVCYLWTSWYSDFKSADV